MNDYLLTIDDLLTEEECKFFIKLIDDGKLEKIDRANYAIYDRLIYNNKEFADLIYNRIKHLIPEIYNNQKIVCVNNHIRLSKYDINGEFKMHRDAINQDTNGNRSIFTVNVFLNDNFEGGETDFFYEDKTLRFSCKPKIGRGAIFYNQQFHQGNKVLSGNKYLFRTDVMI